MGPAHSFFGHIPNWAGFGVLIGVWIIFRSFLLRWRRGAAERMRMSLGMPGPGPLPPGQLSYAQVRCPRCAASAPGAARFCPHCGLSFSSMPPPIVVRGMNLAARRSWLMVVLVLLGVIGLAAYVFWRMTPEEQQAPPPPLPQRTHTHYHYP